MPRRSLPLILVVAALAGNVACGRGAESPPVGTTPAAQQAPVERSPGDAPKQSSALPPGAPPAAAQPATGGAQAGTPALPPGAPVSPANSAPTPPPASAAATAPAAATSGTPAETLSVPAASSPRVARTDNLVALEMGGRVEGHDRLVAEYEPFRAL